MYQLNFYLQDEYRYNLRKRDIDMDEFINAMKCNKTSGLDLMVLMLGDMFGLSTIALIEDRMWKSHDIDVKKADIYCLIYKSG